jgi:acetyltransferase-like isoleucine patch superfamily enzyme
MGLETGQGPYYAVLAADLQEPPELIVSFFRTLESEPFDVTIGTRETRGDPLMQTVLANLFWKLYRRFVQPEVPLGGVDVFGCNLAVRDALLRLRESNSTLIGLLFWLGFRRKSIPYARRPRAVGRSAWTFRRKLRYLMDSCFSLTDLPVAVIMAIGLIGTVTSALLSAVVFIAWLADMIQVPGYTPVILVMLNSFMATMLARHHGKRRLADIREHQGAPPLCADEARSVRPGAEDEMTGYFVHQNGLCETTDIGPRTRIWAFAHVLRGARIGSDCNICDGVLIENDVVLGDRVTVKSGVQLWDGVRLGDGVFVGPNATFANDKFPRSRAYQASGPKTIVEMGASLGANCTVLPGLRIGRHAMIGAGSVVTSDVPPFAIVMGNPARITGYVDSVGRAMPAPRPIEPLPSGESTVVVPGVTLHRLRSADDMRGMLSVAEVGPDIPFEVKRFLAIYDVPSKEVRGERAHRACEQFLICIRGSVALVVDDGASGRGDARPARPRVHVRTMIWTVSIATRPMPWC